MERAISMSTAEGGDVGLGRSAGSRLAIFNLVAVANACTTRCVLAPWESEAWPGGEMSSEDVARRVEGGIIYLVECMHVSSNLFPP